jgi:hypothetical protein
VSEKIDESVTNHLTFVITALFLWIPCRVYADWHMNFETFDWLGSYTALLLIAVGLVACCFVLGFNMVSGSLYKQFVVPAAAISTVCGVVFAWKRNIIEDMAENFSLWSTAFKVGFGFIVCFVLWYIASTVHRYSTNPRTMVRSDQRVP